MHSITTFHIIIDQYLTIYILYLLLYNTVTHPLIFLSDPDCRNPTSPIKSHLNLFYFISSDMSPWQNYIIFLSLHTYSVIYSKQYSSVTCVFQLQFNLQYYIYYWTLREYLTQNPTDPFNNSLPPLLNSLKYAACRELLCSTMLHSEWPSYSANQTDYHCH